MSGDQAPGIILISRNRERQLPHVLTALAGNTLRPAEVILADDASTDNTVDVFNTLCGELGLSGRAIVHDSGETLFRINSMRNAGLQACTCERAIILDADHVPGPLHVATHMAMLDAGQATLSTGPRLEYAFEDATGPVNYMWGHEPYAAVGDGAAGSSICWQLAPASNMGMYLSFGEKVGWFDTDYDGAYGYDDSDFAYRAHKCGAKFAGCFGAYVIHIPHETVFGHRQDPRNANLFRDKHGFDLAYPPFVEAVTHSATWSKRYAEFLAGPPRLSEGAGELGPPPAMGEPSVAATRWACENVGGRFLLKLAWEKMVRRIKGRPGKP